MPVWTCSLGRSELIHPPVTKDITNQVTWNSNTPDMVTVSSTGLITDTGFSCGIL